METNTPVPPIEDALRASAAMDDYAARARNVASGGSKTESFEEAAKNYSASEDKLHGDRGPNQTLNREQPVHVLMCYMLASGKTPKEVAEATGYAEASVKLIAKQPWFRKRFLRITSEAGKNQVESFLAGETLSSLETLVLIRDSDKAPGATRIAAANSILDRALGKPTQKVETENHNYTHKAASGSEIDRQIAAAESELKSLGHTTELPGSN
jgi:hypothetical protein